VDFLVGVGEGVGSMVGVGEGVGSMVGVGEGVGSMVGVGEGVGSKVGVGEGVGSTVGVGVSFTVGVTVGVGFTVCVGVGVDFTIGSGVSFVAGFNEYVAEYGQVGVASPVGVTVIFVSLSDFCFVFSVGFGESWLKSFLQEESLSLLELTKKGDFSQGMLKPDTENCKK